MDNFFIDDFINLLIVDMDPNDYANICKKCADDIYLEIKLILQMGISFERRVLALEFAIENEWIGCIKLLMKYDTSDPMILTALLPLTLPGGNVRILKLLYKNGANLGQYADHLLAEGAHFGHISFVEYLLERIDPSHLNNAFNPPILMAIKPGNLSMVKLLWKNGADLNVRNGASLLLSARYGCIDIVSFLLKNKVNINTSNLIGSKYEKKYGPSALINSCLGDNLSMCKYLLKNGADYHKHNQMALAKSIIRNNIKVVELLLKYGADPNTLFLHADTIQSISKNRTIKLLKLLLVYGLDPNCNDGILLIECVQKNNVELVKLLVECGADVSSQNGIVLKIAVVLKSVGLVDILLDYDYDYNSYLKWAFDYAVRNNYLDIENLFLRKSNIKSYPIECII